MPVVDRRDDQPAVLDARGGGDGREEAAGMVVQRLPGEEVVEARPGHHRPDVVELPVDRAHGVRLQAPPVADGGLDGEGLLQLAEIDEVREIVGARK